MFAGYDVTVTTENRQEQLALEKNLTAGTGKSPQNILHDRRSVMKKSKMHPVTAALCIALCAALAIARYCDAKPAGPPHGGPNPFMRCVDKLSLSAESSAKIKTLMQAHFETMTADRDTMKAAMEAYFTALTAATQDSAALAEAQQTIITLEQKRAESRFSLESAIVGLLSADEAAQLRECLISSMTEPPVSDNGTKSMASKRK